MSKIFRIFSFTVILLSLVFGCSSEDHVSLKEGIWRGEFDLQGNTLPINFELKTSNGQYEVYLFNAEEKLKLDEITVNGDSIHIPMHIFDADIKAKVSGTTMSGRWTKNYEDDYVVPFKAQHGLDYRFDPVNSEVEDLNGTWAVTFVHHEDNDTTRSVGIFKHNGNKATGTFLNPTGDYRYLEGVVDGNQMKLSTFDGGHGFLFTATKNEDGSLSGDFWSGPKWHETWTAIKDDNATLPHADSVTYLKDGYDKLTFSFPDLEGNLVSPENYTGKVLILQIFGTWCPNCMDETKFLKEWYDKNHQRGVEILGLAYEAKDNYNYARDRVLKMVNKWDIKYDFVIAGHKNKKGAAKTLPMLNHVLSYPTTIFLTKSGEVHRIHTGFTGPGTGHYYEQFIKEFNVTVDELLAQ